MPDKKDNILNAFNNLETFIESLGDEFASEYKSVKHIINQYVSEKYHIAVLGQFKRGKSTFLNSLLGADILPSAVLPLTAIPTYIFYSEYKKIIINFKSGKNQTYFFDSIADAKNIIYEYATEEKNPENRKNVSSIELYYDSEILDNGLVLIDTPGIGSTNRHNTEVTLNFLPQCDAAVFLVSPDPPITEVEVEFLKEVKSKVARLFFVLNKIDYLDEDEKESLLKFLVDVFNKKAEIKCSTDDIFSVSAKTALKSFLSNNIDLREKSGINRVISFLNEFCATEKKKAVEGAVKKKALFILDGIIFKMSLSLKSMEMPLKELEEKLRIFAEKIVSVEEDKRNAYDILAGDSKRLHESLEEEAEKLRQKSSSFLKEVIKENYYKYDDLNEDKLQDILDKVIPEYFEHEFGVMAEIFKKKRKNILLKHQERINKLSNFVKQTAAELFQIRFDFTEEFEPIKIVNQPYWVTHTWRSRISFVSPKLIDKILPINKRKDRIIKRIFSQIDDLVITNVENIRWSIYQTIDRELIYFKNVLDEKFNETVKNLKEAIERAFEKKESYSEEVDKVIDKIRKNIETSEKLKSSFR